MANGHRPIDGGDDGGGRRISSSSASGGWSAALFIIGMEVGEMFAYHGFVSNLITYLTGQLGQSTASAAANVNALTGASFILPLVSGFVADAYVGRYRTIVIASFLYALALGMITLSATVPFLRPPTCPHTIVDSRSCGPSQFQVTFFYFWTYAAAAGFGVHKPCLQAFGADQFDDKDPVESRTKSSFFNWWYFGVSVGTVLTLALSSYVQDNVGWGIGFGMPCVSMVIALVVFFMGTRTYRFPALPSRSPLSELVTRSWIGVWKDAWRWRPNPNVKIVEAPQESLLPVVDRPPSEQDDNGEPTAETERGVLRLFPIWTTSLMYAVAFSQSQTFFTKQGSTVDRRIGPNFLVPPAALQGIINVSILAFIPTYDRVFVPVARTFTGTPSGVTMLQRIGIGKLISVASMVVAALVEAKRLQIAVDAGLVYRPDETVPMSLCWLLPQYILCGVSQSFAVVGLQEFFYDQMPDASKSLGMGLYLSIYGAGSLASSLLVVAIDSVSSRDSRSWFSDNLNLAHIDYFYWLLATLCSVELIIFLHFAQSFQYNKPVERSST